MKKSFLKRTADFLEKFAIGSLLVGVFQGQAIGLYAGASSLALAYIFTYLEAK